MHVESLSLRRKSFSQTLQVFYVLQISQLNAVQATHVFPTISPWLGKHSKHYLLVGS